LAKLAAAAAGSTPGFSPSPAISNTVPVGAAAGELPVLAVIPQLSPLAEDAQNRGADKPADVLVKDTVKEDQIEGEFSTINDHNSVLLTPRMMQSSQLPPLHRQFLCLVPRLNTFHHLLRILHLAHHNPPFSRFVEEHPRIGYIENMNDIDDRAIRL
jgi:hypothetical protein